MALTEKQQRQHAALACRAGQDLEHAATALDEYIGACQRDGEVLRLDDDRLVTRSRCRDLGARLMRAFGNKD